MIVFIGITLFIFIILARLSFKSGVKDAKQKIMEYIDRQKNEIETLRSKWEQKIEAMKRQKQEIAENKNKLLIEINDLETELVDKTSEYEKLKEEFRKLATKKTAWPKNENDSGFEY